MSYIAQLINIQSWCSLSPSASITNQEIFEELASKVKKEKT